MNKAMAATLYVVSVLPHLLVLLVNAGLVLQQQVDHSSVPALSCQL